MNPAIITGSFRSGTSAITRLIQSLGVDVGSNLLPGYVGNVHGHFEEVAFLEFHDRLIDRYFPKRAPFCEWLPLADATITYTDEDRAEAQKIWDAHKAAGGTAWKDPRTSLFLDLWTEIIPDAQVVICLRHPYQVHQSLLRRGEAFMHVDYSSAIVGWTIYNERILKTLATLPLDRFLVVEVGAAFRQPRELAEALSQFLERPSVESAVNAIEADEFHFEDDIRYALDHFEEFLPQAGSVFRQLKQYDQFNPISPTAASEKVPPIKSLEARLIEFEEQYGLRARARKMLIRSVSVDRQRTSDLYQKLLTAANERNALIDDLSRLNDTLKRRVHELTGATDADSIS